MVSHHGRASKLLLFLITLRVLPGIQKAKFRGKNGKTFFAFGGEINIVDEKYLSLGAL